MSSIIKFKAISGAFDEGPLSYLLEIDDYRFLLDCGWNEACSVDVAEQYQQHVKSVDAILISYPDIPHLGALPYLVSKMNLTCQIFSTVPVYKMGQMYLYDLCLESEDFNLFDLDDIDNAFDKIQQLKYSQTINLKGKGQGLQITALPGGHMIGGTIWRILKDGEEEIIYAVDYNHNKERHLNGCVMNLINKPTLLITDSYNFLYSQPKKRLRDEKFLGEILKTLRSDGNMLICSDTAGRMLELAHFLDGLWRNENSGLFSYSIALLNNVSISVIDFAKSQVEWMCEKIVQSFEKARSNPFDFKHIKLCCSLNEVARVNQPSRNKLVLVSMSDMECGNAKSLFLEWCENPKNTILFTQRPTPNTLAHRLVEMAESADERPNKKIVVEVKHKVKLEGDELEEYRREQLEKEKEKIEKLKKSAELESIDDDSSSSEEDGENILNMESNIPTDKHDLMKIPETKSRFFKHRKQYPMYPYKERQIKWDDYGEAVKIEDFVPLSELNQANEAKQESNQDVEMAQEQLETIDENLADQVPTKFVSEKVEINVRCQISFIDYEGRSDSESIKNILSNIKPRNLILIHGPERATNEMHEFCAKQQVVSVPNRIFTPRCGETVNATLETQIFNVRLKDDLMSSLKFQKLKDYELAWVDAVIRSNNQAEHEFGQTSQQSSGVDFGYSLHPLPREMTTNAHKTVFVNEPKLSDLKQILTHNDIQAEFHGGVLVCNGIVALKKNQAGRIILEGVVSEDYYKIRKILYDQYAML